MEIIKDQGTMKANMIFQKEASNMSNIIRSGKIWKLWLFKNIHEDESFGMQSALQGSNDTPLSEDSDDELSKYGMDDEIDKMEEFLERVKAGRPKQYEIDDLTTHIKNLNAKDQDTR